MSKILYYQVQFVTLHQKKPQDWQNIGGNSPVLSIQGIKTYTSKYGLEFGYGDPGENKNADTFDFPEFTISGATFTKPSDYNSRLSYEHESIDSVGISYYNKWGIVSVSDDFTIPSELVGNGEWGSAFYSTAATLLGNWLAGTSESALAQSLANSGLSALTAYGIYEATSSHLDKQMTLLDGMMNDRISGEEGLVQFEANARQFGISIADAALPAPLFTALSNLALVKLPAGSVGSIIDARTGVSQDASPQVVGNPADYCIFRRKAPSGNGGKRPGRTVKAPSRFGEFAHP